MTLRQNAGVKRGVHIVLLAAVLGCVIFGGLTISANFTYLLLRKATLDIAGPAA
jgi:hypothetical protein